MEQTRNLISNSHDPSAISEKPQDPFLFRLATGEAYCLPRVKTRDCMSERLSL